MPIVQLSQAQQQTLSAPQDVGLPLSSPPSRIATHDAEPDAGVETGVWECTPGRWRRQIKNAEFCHFIQGRCRFIADSGEVFHIQAGDALYFPANSEGIWEVDETVRKTYCLLP